MQGRRVTWSWLGLGAAWLMATTVSAQQAPAGPAMLPSPPSVFSSMHTPIPLEQMTPQAQRLVLAVLQQPTLTAHGPTEAFLCRPALYYWLVDHPDQAAHIWLGLGAKCAGIESLGEGHFRWHDAQMGEMRWDTVLRTPHQCIWYAYGKVRPGPLLPYVIARGVVVLSFVEGADTQGHPAVRHQMELVLQANSHAIALATRLFGASVPHMTEQYVGQMETFFGALAWYLSKHPEKAPGLLGQTPAPQSPEAPAGSEPPGLLAPGG